jgi:hypothetical protein
LAAAGPKDPSILLGLFLVNGVFTGAGSAAAALGGWSFDLRLLPLVGLHAQPKFPGVARLGALRAHWIRRRTPVCEGPTCAPARGRAISCP